MKILTLCNEFPPVGGGGAQVAAGLSRQLVRMGHQVDLVTMGFGKLPVESETDGVRVLRVPCGRRRAYYCAMSEAARYVAAASALLRRLLRTQRYNVIHAHFIFPDGFLAWRAHQASGLAYVITAHGSDVAGYNPHRFKLAHKLLAPLWRRVVEGASAVICPSGRLQDLVRRQSARAKTLSVPNGIDAAVFRAPAEPRRDQILVVTRMLERKGIQYLIEAINGFRRDWEVHIVGDGPYLPALRAAAERQAASVKFWGWMDNASPELKRLYETSRIFVLPSEAENFPIVLLEAMASGLAIITTKDTGCAEVIGDAGLLIPARNAAAIKTALQQLTENPQRCQALGQAARRRLEEHFSWPVVARRYVEIYQQAAGSSGRALK